MNILLQMNKTPRIGGFRCIAILFFAIFFSLCSCTERNEYMVITGYAQGGTYTVKFNHAGVRVPPEEIRDSIDAILSRIDKSLSGYNKGSVLSRLNAGERVAPDPLFLDMYEKSYAVFEATGGAVDVTGAPLFDAWGFGFSNDTLPSESQVEAARNRTGMDKLHKNIRSLISDDGTLASVDLVIASEGFLPKLNFNAVAQGYSCDVVADYLYSIGVKDMLVDIGEFFCDGLNPSGKPWSIGIDRPVDGNNQAGADMHGVFKAPEGPHGIVTSGNYRKFYVSDGKKYAHTIDPRTGYPVSHSLLCATVVAEDAMTADAYATYCMVVGLEASKAFLEEKDGFEGCLIYDEDGVMKTWCSSGFVLEEL